MSETQTIGFIGVGLMGHGMAKNVIDAGHRLKILGHRNREPVEELKSRGAEEVASAAELGGSCDVVVLCLPGSKEVEAAIAGPDGILSSAAPGLVIIDCSTSNPVSTRQLGEACAAKGVDLVDAPLSRTPKEAWEGTLDSMVGADEAVFLRVKPLIETWSGKIVRTGGPGTGHTMKLLNNFVSLGYASLYSEALAIGAKAGLSAEIFDSVIRGGRMDCGFYQTFMKYVIERDRNAHKFALRNAHKDMRYVDALANEAGIASHLASTVKNGLATAEAIGRGEDYLPMLSDIVAELNGIRRDEA